MVKKVQHSPASELRRAAFDLAAAARVPVEDESDSRFMKLDKKLQDAAIRYAEWRVKQDTLKAQLELGAVNAHELDRVMRGHVARAEPPGLLKAIRKAKREETRRDKLLGRFSISKMTWFQKEILGGVVEYGHKAEDFREERILRRFLELGVIEACSGPRKRRFRLTEYGHEVWSVVRREMKGDAV